MGKACTVVKRPEKSNQAEIIVNPALTNSIVTRNTGLSKKSTYKIRKPTSFFLFRSIILNKTQGSPSDTYRLIRPLGEGAYGKVFLVERKDTEEEFAMKEIKRKFFLNSPEKSCCNIDNANEKIPSNEDYELVVLRTEIETLTKLDHPNIVKIFEFYTSEDKFFIIFEYFHEGNLMQFFKKYRQNLRENHIAFILFQILSAVNYLHTNKLVHRDIKPENIMISEIENSHPILKLIDFGSTKDELLCNTEQRVVGSTYYIAPEAINKRYSTKSDIWSIGVIFYLLLTGELPFYSEKEHEIEAKILLGSYELNKDNLSKEAKNLLRNMLETDLNNRYSANQALKHNFFKIHNVKANLFKKILKTTKEKLKKIVKNIENFRPQFKIQYVALLTLFHELENYSEDIQFVKYLFHCFDEDNTGFLKSKNIIEGFEDLLESKEVFKNEEFFRFMDCNSKGKISFKEFAIACVDLKGLLIEDNLREVFERFDVNGTGKIGINEIKSVYGKKENFVKEELEQLVKEINSEGFFTYQDFVSVMLKLVK